ncbi:protein FAM151B [Toxorhynchites rutilus septentrionalis]|uniref:protein FAM151B n=1 Tax=Toxorhynchites rutilus septentrionalis TaxID=329112 RepID=UPI002478B566|nr:protein FAM151B [Toxorhynchites rutilus septentrionalis]
MSIAFRKLFCTMLYLLYVMCFGNIFLNYPIIVASKMSTTRLTDITWAHAVNSDSYLTEVLQGDINFIEADILMGYLLDDADSQNEIPIMAHPPLRKSDLSLNVFLQRIYNFNSVAAEDKIKGVKLDFKSIDAFEKSVQVIHEFYDTTRYPTWINADILSGPVNNTETIPVDPTRFFKSSKQLGSVVLSIGWTTKWGKDSSVGNYSNVDVERMINVIRSNEIDVAGYSLTFPIRAGIAACSLEELAYLYRTLKDSNDITFTIWSGVEDAVDVDKLKLVMKTIGLNKIYVDVPEILRAQLNLS